MSYRNTIDAATVRYTPPGAGVTVSTVENRLRRTLSIVDYGATGDGVTDDTTAIQNAVNALVPGDTLEFPQGSYVLTANITVGVGGVLFRGTQVTGLGGQFWDGPVAHLIATSTGISIFELVEYAGQRTFISTSMSPGGSIYTATDTNPAAVTFDGLSFHNRSGTQFANTIVGIDCTATDETTVTIRNCYFARISTGVLGPVSTYSEIWIENCIFVGCDVSPITTSQWFTRIFANRFYEGGPIVTPTGRASRIQITENQWNGGAMQTAFFFDSSASGPTLTDFIQISDNLFTIPGDWTIDHVNDLIFSGNIFEGPTTVSLGSGVNRALLSGNIIHGGTGSTVALSVAGDNCLITGNILMNESGNGSLDILAAASNTVVQGNSFQINDPPAKTDYAVAVLDAGTDSRIEDSLILSTFGATGEIGTEDFVNCTSGGITVTLPAAATAGSGRVILIKDRDGNANGDNITIEGNGSETIDDSLTFVMNVNYQSVTLVTDGSNWMVI